ncbi:MAG: 50S ribosomal protein L3 [Candidatus Omnitrophota bacterium]|jgi:large subunit ribosomal protein L3|nr:MAG: 50S ribosomal protein L3 [Candidatus Omnitrophota bacterium]
MVKAILGRKLRMTQIYTKDGRLIPLTAVEVGPCPIVQIKTEKNDGYNALQIGFLNKDTRLVNMPMTGHFGKSKVDPQRILREIRIDSVEGFELGQEIKGNIFESGDKVDVSGISKGHGFQGGVKRHNWKGGRMTHGSMFHRRIGAISPGTGQARIFKGKNLPGHMGHEKVTIQNIEVVKVDAENNLIYLRGGLPGPNGGIVFVKKTTKTKTKKSK